MKRISHLDGMRGLAILMVFFYHAYSRWNDLLGYNDAIGNGGVIQHFHLGVQLFFLISGFVILLSLQRATSFIPFMYRRWLRLFPAMLICTVIIVLTADIFDERVSGDRSWTAILPGLIFLDPYVLKQVTGIEFSSLDGPFWSIYVEMKFYVFAALFYFWLGSRKMVHAVFGCYLAWLLGGYLQDVTGLRSVQLGHSVLNNLDFEYFGWFSAGAAIMLGTIGETGLRARNWFIYGVFIAITVSLIEFSKNIPGLFLSILVITIFSGSMKSEKIKNYLSMPIFLWFGFVSYPLYLIHENILISGTLSLLKLYPVVPVFLWPIFMLGGLSTIAWVIAILLEPLLKSIIFRAFNFIAASLRFV